MIGRHNVLLFPQQHLTFDPSPPIYLLKLGHPGSSRLPQYLPQAITAYLPVGAPLVVDEIGTVSALPGLTNVAQETLFSDRRGGFVLADVRAQSSGFFDTCLSLP